MGLKELWGKTSFGRKAEEEKQKKLEEDELRKKVQEQIKPEIEKIKMEKIRQEELAKARGEYKEEKKKNPLAMLGEEFKQSNIGSDQQMSKIMGKSSGSGNSNDGYFSGDNLKDTNKLSSMITGTKVKTERNFGDEIGINVVQKERDIPGMLGRDSRVRNDYSDVIGMKRKQAEEKVGSSKVVSDDRIKKMLGK